MFIFLLDNNTSPLQLRLIEGSDKQGRLEILYYGVWGFICFDSFSFNSANVACRRLGFPGAVEVQQINTRSTTSPTSPMWLTYVHCFGNETAIEQCPHSGFGNPAFGCDYYRDVGVQCIGMYVCMYVHIYVFFIDESM